MDFVRVTGEIEVGAGARGGVEIYGRCLVEEETTDSKTNATVLRGQLDGHGWLSRGSPPDPRGLGPVVPREVTEIALTAPVTRIVFILDNGMMME